MSLVHFVHVSNFAMESLVDGVSSSLKDHISAPAVGCNPPPGLGANRPPHPPSLKQPRYEGASSASNAGATDNGMKTSSSPTGSVISSKHSQKTSHDHTWKEGVSNSSKHHLKSNNQKQELMSPDDVLDQMAQYSSHKQVSTLEIKSYLKHPVYDSENSSSSSLLESVDLVTHPAKGTAEVLNSRFSSQSGISFCPSPQNSFYSATQYTEAKQSFTNTEVSEGASSVEKSAESVEVGNSCDIIESRKTSTYRGSTGSDISDESSSCSLSSAMYKPHKANDTRWEAIQAIRTRDGLLGLNHFKLLTRLGCGDIGCVYLSELTGTRSYFAMKVMDKAALESRKKLLRAQTEREILQSLDHPFLPTLYTHFETEKFSCLVMEFCPGGDLHALRQRQPGKYFPEHAARLGTFFHSFPFFPPWFLI
ncbi:unnamed protein product [Ilex paraguariensis]|uniref:non-specific serine/threonine protein kinase n=1 Tax=Ilex paraguariensis TaxID=185542 RepID=A0ABC8U916_9AQUA